MDLKAYRQKAYEQFPELMGKLIILSKPIRPAVYGGQLFDLVKEECPEILKTSTLIDDDETAMGRISQRIDEGITQVYSLPLSDIKTMHRASPVKLINPVDFHERNKLQQILSELSKAVPGSLNEVSEDLRAQYEEWNFFNLLGQALWNIKENPRERSDNIQVSWLNNETAFGALFAAANMKKIHGARANEVLNLIKDSYALGLLNGAHICMNAAHAIDYIQSTDALAESWSDIYESSKKVFEDRFELKDDKHLQHFFSIRGNGFRVLSVKQIINALDDMEKDQDLSAYLKIYDQAAARRVKDYNDESSRLKWLLESVALELDWKAEQDLKTCSSLLMELIELEYGIDEYTRELEEKREQFKLALENLDSDYLRSELKDIEKALADPFEDIKERQEDYAKVIEENFPGIYPMLDQCIRDAFNANALVTVGSIDWVYNPEARSKYQDFEARYKRLQSAWLLTRAQDEMADLGLTEASSKKYAHLSVPAPTRLQ